MCSVAPGPPQTEAASHIHVARSYVNDPQQSLAPNCIPFAFTNLSMYSQYLSKDKVVGFAQPLAEDIEVHTLADHDEIAEMMRGPQNHIPRKTQTKYKMPIIPLDKAFITSPADVPGPRKVDLQDADITPGTRSAFDVLCEKYSKVFSKETLERAGVITKSMSPWASPIVVVPKKSQPGEPPKKRLCINFRKINDLQQKIITEGKSKGCLSLI